MPIGRYKEGDKIKNLKKDNFKRYIVISLVFIFLLSSTSASSVVINEEESNCALSTNAKVVYVDMFVRKSSGGSWQNSISGTVGENIDVKLEIENVGLLPRNPIVNVVLPPLLDYVSGSASPSYDDFFIEEGYEDLIWESFNVPALSTKEITFKAKIKNTGTETIYVQVIPYDVSKDPDEDEADVTGTVPLDVDANGPYSGTRCNAIQFSGSASGGDPPYTWNWDFGDGSTSSLQNPAHNYGSDGTFTASLTVTDSSSNSETDTATVTINTPDLVADAHGPYSGSTGSSVSFSGSASGGCSPYSYYWDFGDGGTSSQQNPTHTYNSEDTYTVTFTVTDSKGLTDEDTTTATIADDSIVANAHGPYSGNVGQQIQFSGSVSGGTSPYQWHWNFGDGGTSNLQNPKHSYSSKGTFTVTLTVTDSKGKTDSDTTSANIKSTSIDVDAGGPYSGFLGGSIQFSGSASGGTSPYQWHWDFGDGGTSSLQNPSHTYQNIGIYTVTLTVIDNNGADGSDTTSAVVQPQGNDRPVKPTKPSGPTEGNKNIQYSYTTSTTEPDGDKLYYLFDWGDGNQESWLGPFSSGETITASHTWTQTGDFAIKVKAKDQYGAESDWSDPLTVSMPKGKTGLFKQYFEKIYTMFPILNKIFSLFFY